MRYSSICTRLSGPGSDAWTTHFAAMSAQERGEDVIILSIGDPDFDTPPPIVAAAVQALEAGDTHYDSVAGRDTLRAAVARSVADRTGAPLTASNVAVTIGAQNALFCAAALLLDHGDEALALSPMYVTYPATIQASGAALAPVPCPAAAGWRPDLNALEAGITPRTRAIFFASPVNPTGCVLTCAELERIIALAARHDLWIVADEVYAEMTFERPHTSILSIPEARDRAVVCGSLSKSHAMTGWRLGWTIGPEPFTAHMARMNLAMTYGAPAFVQAAAAAALTGDQSPVAAMRDAYRRRRDLAVAGLAGAPGLRSAAPEAGMFMLVDVRETGLSSADFARRLFQDQGVSVLDGGAFGPEAAGAVRLSFAASEAAITEGCARIQRFAAALHAAAPSPTAGPTS